MKKAILFDLGNTLAYYFEKSEFPEILKKSVTEVQSNLRQRTLLSVSEEVMWGKVKEEDHESSDYQVRPLEGRLTRIFKIRDKTQSSDLIGSMCRWFMKPIFARVRIYQDTIATIKELKSRGYKLAIVSNATWGSPASLWREHLESIDLNVYFDTVVLCRDVGWRKPARQIFEYALMKLQVASHDCAFVGDDPRWDFVGPKAVGIASIVINREGTVQQVKDAQMIDSLHRLIDKLAFL